jgi:hypothetical protein
MASDPQPPANAALPSEFPLAAGDGAVAIALARHLDAPIAGSHIDLFLGPADAPIRDPDARIARAFRLPLCAWDADAPAAGIHPAVELEPHRAEYLGLDVPRELSRGRGRIEPLARFRGHAAVGRDGIEVRWAGWRARGRRVGVEDWRFELAPEPADATAPAKVRT